MNYNSKIKNFLEQKNASRKSLIFALKKDLYKTAEAIEIDGVWYEEDESGNLREVNNNQNISLEEIQQPESLPITLGGNEYVFTQGEVYSDALGKYRVEEILDNGDLKITYIDGRFSGQERVYSSLSRAKIIHNEELREDARNNMRTIHLTKPSQYFTLGYIAKHGRIWVEIPKRLVPEFENLYRKFTGEDPKQYLKINNGVGGYAMLKEIDDRIRPMQLRVAFKLPEVEVLNNMDVNRGGVKWGVDGGRLTTSDPNYLKSLFKIGFTIGNNVNNVDKIRSNIPPEMVEEFNHGFNF